jgi:glycolate oxidase
LQEKRTANVITAKDAAEAELLWRARRAAGPAVFCLRPSLVVEDVTVPVSRLTEMIRKAVEISKRRNIPIGVLAHAGDGNLHPIVLFDRRDQEESARADAACEDLVREAVALGGTLSGEHGIGMAKAPFMPLEMNPAALAVTRGIKKSLDPKGILNPGKFV